jgi:cytochrome P450
MSAGVLDIDVDGALPLLGNALQILRDPLGYFPAQRARGPVVRIRIGTHPVYVLTRPELARRVLVDDHRSYDKGGPFIKAVRQLGREGLATCDDSTHQRQRPLMQPAFHPSNLASHTDVIRSAAAGTVGSWQDGEVLDVNRQMYALAAEIVAKTLFEHSEHVVDRLTADLPILMGGLFRRLILPVGWVHRLPLAANRRYDRAERAIRSAIDRLIAEHDPAAQGSDLLAMIVAARSEETGEGMSDQEIHDQVMTMLVGAIETTGSLLAWTLYEVARHPEVERRLWAEIDEHTTAGQTGLDGLDGLAYTRMVLHEALRLHPPAPILSRIAVEDVVLEGVRIPAGSDVLFSLYALHRDPEVFPEPDRFDPDRWSAERFGPAQRRGFFGFSAGRRKCIGDSFAMLEATVTIAAIARTWRLRPADDRPVKPLLRTTLRPASLHMVARLRPAHGIDGHEQSHAATAAAPAPGAPRSAGCPVHGLG